MLNQLLDGSRSFVGGLEVLDQVEDKAIPGAGCAASHSNTSAPRPPRSRTSTSPSPTAPYVYGFLPETVPPRFSLEVGESAPSTPVVPTLDLNATPVPDTHLRCRLRPHVQLSHQLSRSSLFGKLPMSSPRDERYYEEPKGDGVPDHRNGSRPTQEARIMDIDLSTLTPTKVYYLKKQRSYVDQE